MFGVTSATACCCAPPVTNCPNKWNNCPEFLTVSVPTITTTKTRRVKALAFNPSWSWWTRDDFDQCVNYRSCNLTIGQIASAEYWSISFSGLVFQRMASNGSTCGQSSWGQCCQKYKLVTGLQQTGTVTAVYSLAEAHIYSNTTGGNPCQIVWKTTQAAYTASLAGSVAGSHNLTNICGALGMANVPDPGPTQCRPYLNIEVNVLAFDQLRTTYPHTVSGSDVCLDDCYYDLAGTIETAHFGFWGRYRQAWPLQPIAAPVICPGQLGAPDTASMEFYGGTVDLRNLIQTDQCSDPAFIPCAGGSFANLPCVGNYCQCTQVTQTQNGFASILP